MTFEEFKQYKICLNIWSKNKIKIICTETRQQELNRFSTLFKQLNQQNSSNIYKEK